MRVLGLPSRLGAALALGAVLGSNGAAPVPPERIAAARRSILEGVESIASTGVPGPLAALSPESFVLVAGRLDRHSRLPVAVGAFCGEGRVVALGHGGMLGAEALEHDGTRRFMGNAVRWLAGDDAHARPLNGGDPIRVLLVGNPAMAQVLEAHGGTACESVPRNGWAAALDRLSPEVLVVDAHWIGEADRPIVMEHLRRGGGLLTAGLGWGWLQLNPGRDIHDHPGNRLLAECGIAWCDGTLETTGARAFIVTREDAAPRGLEALHALAAMGEIDASLGDERGVRDLAPQAAATITAALRVAPHGHPMLDDAARMVASHRGLANPAQGRPVCARDAAKRALLGMEIELERRAAPDEITAHPSAAAFPGAVPADVPRVTRTVEIDRSVNGWHSTGLYAPPGEVVTVRWMPAPAVAREAAEIGAVAAPGAGSSADAGLGPGGRLRIGCHTDHLWHLDRWERAPDIVRSWALPSDGSPRRVASAFGGLVYIETPRRGEGVASLQIEGAIEAPRFVLGRTTPEQWAMARSAPAPWGELESAKVIVSVPSAVLRELDDPAPLMEFWDRISDAHATLAAIPLDPPRPHRFVADLQISAGYMHSGYPIMTHLDAAKAMTSLAELKRGSWGLLHELGHNHQEPEWTFDGTVEVTVNLFTLHAIDTICEPPEGDRGHPAVNEPPSLEAHLRAGAPFEAWKQDPFLALHMYVQLERAFGWETFRRVFAEYRSLPRADRPRADDEKRDQWMVRFSRACGRNLGPFFEAWGVPTSAEARASVADLPSWMPDDWPQVEAPRAR